MIRYECDRDLPPHLAKAKGRNAVAKTTNGYEATVDEALAWIKQSIKASEEIAPGYMPIVAIRLYDDDEFKAWVRGSRDDIPAPLLTLGKEEIAAMMKGA